MDTEVPDFTDLVSTQISYLQHVVVQEYIPDAVRCITGEYDFMSDPPYIEMPITRVAINTVEIFRTDATEGLPLASTKREGQRLKSRRILQSWLSFMRNEDRDAARRLFWSYAETHGNEERLNPAYLERIYHNNFPDLDEWGIPRLDFESLEVTWWLDRLLAGRGTRNAWPRFRRH